MLKISKITLISILAFSLIIGCNQKTQLQLPDSIIFNINNYYPLIKVEGNDPNLFYQDTSNEFLTGKTTNVEILKTGRIVLSKTNSGYNNYGEYISKIIKTNQPFNAFMGSCKTEIPQKTKLEIYTRGQKQNLWSNWLLIKPEVDIILPEKYDYFQYKIILKTDDPNLTPTLDSISFYFGNIQQKLSNLRSIKTIINKEIQAPLIITREEWGALPPKSEYDPQTPVAIVLHHTWKPEVKDYKGAETIRGIQKYHMFDPATGWKDIGYHYLIGPTGEIFAGRPPEAVGAHVVPNTGKVGISVIGNYDLGADLLTLESYNSLLDLITWIVSKYSIDVNNIFGHRDFQPKSCPGDTIYTKLSEIKDEVKKRLEENNNK